MRCTNVNVNLTFAHGSGRQTAPRPTPPGGCNLSHHGSHFDSLAQSFSRTCTTITLFSRAFDNTFATLD